MTQLILTKAPVAVAEMLIRRPVAEVFEAFVNPDITSRFWFTKGSGRLESGKQVQWDWDMYGVSQQVSVKAVEPHARILVEWPGYGSSTTVEWIFTAREDGSTFVSITSSRCGTTSVQCEGSGVATGAVTSRKLRPVSFTRIQNSPRRWST